MCSTRSARPAANLVLSAWSRLLLAVMCGGALGCSDELEAPDEHPLPPLVDPEAWQPTDDDPAALESHRPAAIECELGSWRLTDLGEIDVDTGACNYLALTQPAGRPVAAGSALSVRFSHLTLYDPGSTDSVGHIALAVGGDVLWERHVSIPARAKIYSEAIVVPFDIPSGMPLHLHLHNHGANEWKLHTLTAHDG